MQQHVKAIRSEEGDRGASGSVAASSDGGVGHERRNRAPIASAAYAEDGPPLVSIVVPVRNEADHIEACLERLLRQDYPPDALELLVIDGRSEDATCEVVRRVQERHPSSALRLLDNPQRTVPAGLNVGISAARGQVIVRMDGHTVPAQDYVTRCVEALAATSAANVGGIIEAEGKSPFGHAVAAASTHRLGAGDARYRVGGEAGYVDTVPFGAFRRELFECIGLFDESMVRNQDAEFNARIHAAGEKVYLDPAIRSVYIPRSSIPALWAQYFQYGWWRIETWRRRPGSLRWRQLVPPLFWVTVALLFLAAPWIQFAAIGLATLLATYVTVVGAVSLRIAGRPATPARVFAAFVVIHFAFSLGFLLNLLSRGRYPQRAGPARIPALLVSEPAVSERTTP